MTWRFGECGLDSATRELTRAGRPVPLTPKALRLLELLLERHPAAVSREEIRDTLWPDTVVSESNLASLVWEVRSAIGDAPRGRFVRTVRGFGYAFNGEVRPGAGHPPVPTTPDTGWHGIGAAALLSLVVLGAIAGLWLGWLGAAPPPPLTIRPITSYPGPERSPALSHDGSRLAFVRELEGTPNLYLTLLGPGEPLLLARDALAPAWSPDGRELAFVRHREENGEEIDEVFVIPALGGAERCLGAFQMASAHGLSWSPDGTSLALPHRASLGGPTAIRLVSLDGTESRTLTRPPPGYRGDADPRFAPDGRTLAFARVEALGASDVYLVPSAGGKERRLTRGNHNTQGLAWAPDGRSLAFSAVRLGGGSPFALWRVSVSGGDPVRLGFGEHGMRPTTSRTNGHLAYVRQELRWNIWRAGGPSAPATDRAPRPLISSSSIDYFPRYSPDGQEIAFVSGRSGAQEVWICKADGSRPLQLTFQGSPLAAGPFWSPDGTRLAYNSPMEGNEDVWVVTRSGGFPRRLTASPSLERSGGWSHDGRWIYLISNRSGDVEVWRVPAQGGDVVQVTTSGGEWPFESPDGRFVYYSKNRERGGAPGVWRRPIEGGEETQILDRGSTLRWDLLEEGILFLDEGGKDALNPGNSTAAPMLALFDFNTGELTRLAELPNAAPWGLSVSPNRRWVVYTGWEPPASDIMLVEGFR